MRITSYSPCSRDRKPSPIGVCGLVLSARRITSSTGLMTLHLRKVTWLGEAARQTTCAKSVETCLARRKAQEASGTYGVRGVSQIKFTLSDSFLVLYDFEILSLIKRKNPFGFYCVILILNFSNNSFDFQSLSRLISQMHF